MHVLKTALSRRSFLKGATASGLAIRIGLPALDAMFNASGTAYAAADARAEIEKRFVLWFNGNGISEKYWIPAETGPDYSLTPCLSPLATLRDDVHVISGLDSPAARLPGPGNSHHPSMSALLTGTTYTGSGAGGASFDQMLAQQIGGESRFRSLQIGVSQECFGEAIQRNMSWAGRDRPLPPETLPDRLFDRLFGEKEGGWVERRESILDVVKDDARRLNARLGETDRRRVDEYLTSVRDLERSIAGLPSEYRAVIERPAEGGDLRDWPRIAKLQSDLLVHAFASRQTRVASYMLTKCQGLARFPWLGHTAERHHEYTHGDVETPQGARILRDICRWHVAEFAYFVAKLKATPEGEGTLLDHTCAVFVHEHADANTHKNNGLAAIVAGHAGGIKTGAHSRLTGSMGDLYVTLAQEALGAGKLEFPTAENKLGDIV